MAPLTLVGPEETVRFGERLGRVLAAPLVMGLEGPLGAGKTHLTRGIVSGLDANLGRRVASPTYAVCHTHATSPPVHHFDLYRLEDADDLESVGFWEALDDVVVVEWPGRIAEVEALLDVVVRIERPTDEHRLVRVVGRTPRGLAYEAKLSST